MTLKTAATAVAAMASLCAGPAFADGALNARTAGPPAIATVSLGKRAVEVLAVTQRARADTRFRKDHLEDCQAMGKVWPGYPQPPFVSLDFRVRF